MTMISISKLRKFALPIVLSFALIAPIFLGGAHPAFAAKDNVDAKRSVKVIFHAPKGHEFTYLSAQVVVPDTIPKGSKPMSIWPGLQPEFNVKRSDTGVLQPLLAHGNYCERGTGSASVPKDYDGWWITPSYLRYGDASRGRTCLAVEPYAVSAGQLIKGTLQYDPSSKRWNQEVKVFATEDSDEVSSQLNQLSLNGFVGLDGDQRQNNALLFVEGSEGQFDEQVRFMNIVLKVKGNYSDLVIPDECSGSSAFGSPTGTTYMIDSCTLN